jgi:hypothetical protein
MRSAARSTLGRVTEPESVTEHEPATEHEPTTEPEPATEPESVPTPGGATEPESDSLPVLAGAATVLPGLPPRAHLSAGRGAAIVAIPAVQAAAVAAGGFVAGAAVVGFAQRRSRNAAAGARAGRSRRLLGLRAKDTSAGRAAELLQIVGTRSLLVDVHLLGAPPLRPGR